MSHEFDLYGVFLPPFLVWAVAAAASFMVLRPLLERARILQTTPFRPAMDISLFIILLGVYAFLFSTMSNP
jgi:hypothetical protein